MSFRSPSWRRRSAQHADEVYAKAKSSSNTLYSGDRAGSCYYDVMENTTSTESAQAWSGAIQPGFKSEVHAVVINPFIKYRGLELFGNVERAKGRAVTAKAEYVNQKYLDFPTTDIRNGGKFNGLMVEGVVAF